MLRESIGRPAQVCAVITAATGCFALLNWALGNWKVLTLGPDLAPMAPSSAWSMLLLSCGVFAHNHWPFLAMSRAIAYLSLFGVTVTGHRLSYCVWTEGATSLLPKTERIILGGEDQAPVVVPWDKVVEIVGDLMTPMDMYPERYRVDAPYNNAYNRTAKMT